MYRSVKNLTGQQLRVINNSSKNILRAFKIIKKEIDESTK